MPETARQPIAISSQLFCGMMLLNGLVCGLVCYAAVHPMMQDRAACLGTTGAALEIRYLSGALPGCGLLIATALALSTVGCLTAFHRLRRTNP